ncbi:hypothetical protein OC844_006596 [Tilletia horrida]|nr:hypothetical protein OC844_006596 [Tilletia horrida]
MQILSPKLLTAVLLVTGAFAVSVLPRVAVTTDDILEVRSPGVDFRHDKNPIAKSPPAHARVESVPSGRHGWQRPPPPALIARDLHAGDVLREALSIFQHDLVGVRRLLAKPHASKAEKHRALKTFKAHVLETTARLRTIHEAHLHGYAVAHARDLTTTATTTTTSSFALDRRQDLGSTVGQLGGTLGNVASAFEQLAIDGLQGLQTLLNDLIKLALKVLQDLLGGVTGGASGAGTSSGTGTGTGAGTPANPSVPTTPATPATPATPSPANPSTGTGSGSGTGSISPLPLTPGPVVSSPSAPTTPTTPTTPTDPTASTTPTTATTPASPTTPTTPPTTAPAPATPVTPANPSPNPVTPTTPTTSSPALTPATPATPATPITPGNPPTAHVF